MNDVRSILDDWQHGLIDDEQAMEASGCDSVGELYVAAYAADVEIRFARPVVVQIRGVMSGDPVIAGTRVRPGCIIAEFEARGADGIRESYPTLPEGAVAAAWKWVHGKT